MKWLYISMIWIFVCVVITLLYLSHKVYNMAAFWALLAIISTIYNVAGWMMKIYLDQKYISEIENNHTDFDKEMERIKKEMESPD